MALALIGLAGLFFLGHFLQWFFIKTKFPDILILMMIGFLIGPVMGLVKADQLGEMGGLISVIALVVILYEGGLHLSAKQLARSALPAAGVSLIGFALIAGLTALCTHYLALQSWSVAILTGLGIGSTSSAIVIPMARYLSIKEDTKTVLSLESAFTDVLAIVLFLVIAQAIASGQFTTGSILIGLGPKTLISIAAGLFAGFLWALMKKKAAFLTDYTFASEAWAVLCYGGFELLGYNGAMGVLSLGFALANLDLLPQGLKEHISIKPVGTKELSLLNEIGLLLRNFFFIYLGILIVFSDAQTLLFAFGLAILIFVCRYLATRICFSTSSHTKHEAMVITAMGPRGLACAVLATVPFQMGIEGADWIRNVVFAVIPISIFFTTLFVVTSEQQAFRAQLKKLFAGYKETLPGAVSGSEEPALPQGAIRLKSEPTES